MDKTSTKIQETDSLLSWIGDNIGAQPGAPVSIELMEQDGQHIHASVASTLILINRIRPDERQRILSALRHCAAHGELHAEDLRAYLAWEQDRQAVDRDTTQSATLDVNKVTGLLYTLHWVGRKCEDYEDFEQFHALVLELVPRFGAALENAVKTLGQPRTGLFEEAHHA